VLAKSHDQHEEFFKKFPSVGPKTRENEFHPLNELERKWYIEEKKCKLTKVEVPKGGMVLWDSRTVHDNSRPEFGRPNGSRWRHVVFVSMTPAFWTTPRDINKKRDAYENLLMTTHWSSNGVKTLAPFNEVSKTPTISELSEIAKTIEVKRLMGIEPYDFDDEEPNGPNLPKFIK
jgi:hypothetical protein